jgi:hypothetical protein
MTSVIKHSPRVVFRGIQDGGVLLDLETGEYFSLNSMGCDIWLAADDSTMTDVLDSLRSSMPDAPPQMEEEAETFLTELMQRGLVSME